VIGVLMFFMQGRIGLMVALSLPVSLLATLGIMPSFGLSLNSITILSLIISMGMLVDNSIVVADEYIRRRHLGSGSLNAIVDTIHQLWIPISATAFTTIAAFLPMLVTTGVMGRFIYAIPIVVTASLLFCLLESFLLLPMRLNLVARRVNFSEGDKKTTSIEGFNITDKEDTILRGKQSNQVPVFSSFHSNPLDNVEPSDKSVFPSLYSSFL
jgi:multidrug efflux pump subunit AcrB